MPDNHSHVVGGSTANRVMKCLGCRREIAKAPPGVSSSFADEGTMLHNAMEEILSGNSDVIGMQYKECTLTQELYDNKIVRAMKAFDSLESMEFEVEAECHMASIPGAFGTTDILGRTDDRTVVLDWKFGDGVKVFAEESAQGMFYAGAAMEMPDLADLFEDRDDWPVEIIMVQPKTGCAEEDVMSRWTTNVGRIRQFVKDLAVAIRLGNKPDAPLAMGAWCKFCPAMAMCPEYQGTVESALKKSLAGIDPQELSDWIAKADLLTAWIKEVKKLGHTMLEHGREVPDWKLVAKRATRMWVDKDVARDRILGLVSDPADVFTVEFKTPAQVEAVLKKDKLDITMLSDLTKKVSSGTTMAKSTDKRPAITVPAAALADLAKKLRK